MPFSADWISAAEAISLLARRFHGRTRAIEAVALALREGLLEVRARFKSLAASNGAAHIDASPDDNGFSIPNDIWSKSMHWDDDRKLWDWEDGHFRIDVGPWPGNLHAFSDVHFSRGEIQAMDPENPAFAVLAVPKPPKKQGRVSSARYWNWEPAFADLVVLADYDGLRDGEFGDLTILGNQAKLEKWFENWFIENAEPVGDRTAPSENELRIRASLVVTKLRRRKEGVR